MGKDVQHKSCDPYRALRTTFRAIESGLGFSTGAVLVPGRGSVETTRSRMIAAWLLREHYGLPVPTIGRLLRKVNGQNVWRGIERVKSDPVLGPMAGRVRTVLLTQEQKTCGTS